MFTQKNTVNTVLLGLFFFSTNIVAVNTPDHDAYKSGIQLYSGDNTLLHKRISNQAPKNAQVQHNLNFFKTSQANSSWKSIWNQDTQVPLRIYGSGIPVPKAPHSKDAILDHAHQLLEKHLSLLAPGSSINDFSMISNVTHNGVQVVGFQQFHQGYKVQGGQVSFRYKYNRMVAMASEALPHVKISSSVKASVNSIEGSALNWVKKDIDLNAILTKSATTPVILPVTLTNGSIEYQLVSRVMVESKQPIGHWEIYVNVETGLPVSREQKLMFGTGTASYNTPERWPGGSRSDYPAKHADLIVNGLIELTDDSGEFSWSGTDATVSTAVSGPFVTVDNDQGAEASVDFDISDGGSLTWSEFNIEFNDAQITAFIHANRAKEYVRPWNPSLAWLDQSLNVAVNINDTCNAASNGNALFFFSESLQCHNTGRLTDVIYHEFGHSLHFQSIIQGAGAFDGAMSEGIGDFLAATITNDSAMGVGFFLDANPLREINPIGTEATYPNDLSNDPHISGLIYAGAFWDLREALISALGEVAGVAKTEQLFYATLQRSSDMTSAYIEALIEDDDDGDLANGTPNYCYIFQSFQLHGLALGSEHQLFGQPEINGLNVTVPSLPIQNCDFSVSGMTLEWRSRNTPETTQSIEMEKNDNSYFAHIPFNEPDQVLQYRLTANYSDGSSETKPYNAAAPWYEHFTGITNIISCTDFETDPELSGWTHALTAGSVQDGADDWEWGAPMGTNVNGDPTTAFSGVGVFGNDLGIIQNYNGLYQSDITNEALSPVVSVLGYDHVRLQYRRWLNVEDGQFDQATIYANDVAVWGNMIGGNDLHHQDKEWRFHDVDLTDQVVSGSIQLAFELASDGGLEFGGWTLDDVCVIGYNGPAISDVIFYDGFK